MENKNKERLENIISKDKSVTEFQLVDKLKSVRKIFLIIFLAIFTISFYIIVFFYFKNQFTNSRNVRNQDIQLSQKSAQPTAGPVSSVLKLSKGYYKLISREGYNKLAPLGDAPSANKQVIQEAKDLLGKEGMELKNVSGGVRELLPDELKPATQLMQERQELADSGKNLVDYLTNSSSQVNEIGELNYVIGGSTSPSILLKADKITELDATKLPAIVETGTREISNTARDALSEFPRKITDFDVISTKDNFEFSGLSKTMSMNNGIPYEKYYIPNSEIPQEAKAVLKDPMGIAVDNRNSSVYGDINVVKATVEGKDYYVTRPDDALSNKTLDALLRYKDDPEKFNKDFGKIYNFANEIYSKDELLTNNKAVLEGFQGKYNNSKQVLDDGIKTILNDESASPELKNWIEKIKGNLEEDTVFAKETGSGVKSETENFVVGAVPAGAIVAVDWTSGESDGNSIIKTPDSPYNLSPQEIGQIVATTSGDSAESSSWLDSWNKGADTVNGALESVGTSVPIGFGVLGAMGITGATDAAMALVSPPVAAAFILSQAALALPSVINDPSIITKPLGEATRATKDFFTTPLDPKGTSPQTDSYGQPQSSVITDDQGSFTAVNSTNQSTSQFSSQQQSSVQPGDVVGTPASDSKMYTVQNGQVVDENGNSTLTAFTKDQTVSTTNDAGDLAGSKTGGEISESAYNFQTGMKKYMDANPSATPEEMKNEANRIIDNDSSLSSSQKDELTKSLQENSFGGTNSGNAPQELPPIGQSLEGATATPEQMATASANFQKEMKNFDDANPDASNYDRLLKASEIIDNQPDLPPEIKEVLKNQAADFYNIFKNYQEPTGPNTDRQGEDILNPDGTPLKDKNDAQILPGDEQPLGRSINPGGTQDGIVTPDANDQAIPLQSGNPLQGTLGVTTIGSDNNDSSPFNKIENVTEQSKLESTTTNVGSSSSTQNSSERTVYQVDPSTGKIINADTGEFFPGEGNIMASPMGPGHKSRLPLSEEKGEDGITTTTYDDGSQTMTDNAGKVIYDGKVGGQASGVPNADGSSTPNVTEQDITSPPSQPQQTASETGGTVYQVGSDGQLMNPQTDEVYQGNTYAQSDGGEGTTTISSSSPPRNVVTNYPPSDGNSIGSANKVTTNQLPQEQDPSTFKNKVSTSDPFNNIENVKTDDEIIAQSASDFQKTMEEFQKNNPYASSKEILGKAEETINADSNLPQDYKDYLIDYLPPESSQSGEITKEEYDIQNKVAEWTKNNPLATQEEINWKTADIIDKNPDLTQETKDNWKDSIFGTGAITENEYNFLNDLNDFKKNNPNATEAEIEAEAERIVSVDPNLNTPEGEITQEGQDLLQTLYDKHDQPYQAGINNYQGGDNIVDKNGKPQDSYSANPYGETPMFVPVETFPNDIEPNKIGDSDVTPRAVDTETTFGNLILRPDDTMYTNSLTPINKVNSSESVTEGSSSVSNVSSVPTGERAMISSGDRTAVDTPNFWEVADNKYSSSFASLINLPSAEEVANIKDNPVNTPSPDPVIPESKPIESVGPPTYLSNFTNANNEPQGNGSTLYPFIPNSETLNKMYDYDPIENKIKLKDNWQELLGIEGTGLNIKGSSTEEIIDAKVKTGGMTEKEKEKFMQKEDNQSVEVPDDTNLRDSRTGEIKPDDSDKKPDTVKKLEDDLLMP